MEKVGDMAKPNIKRLLFVEPDEGVRDRLSTELKPNEHGWKLSFCSSAAEALELNEEQPFDMVVSANRLPDQSGAEFFDALKTSAPETVRFLLIEEEERAHFRGLVNSSQQMMVKPLDVASFISRVNRAFALRAVIANPAILKLVGSADSLPPLPRVFQMVTEKLNDPNAALSDVARILSEDIVLSSKVLKLANSALFNLREPAKDITHAVGLLGSSTVSSLVLSQSVSDTFDCGPENEKFAEELNRHSLECGALASKILQGWKANRTVVEQAVFCGIMHDIGKLVLAKYAPEKWPDILERVKEGVRPDIQIERAALDIGHSEVAAYLLAIWGFPDDQVAAVAFHHEPLRFHDQEFDLLCALHLAENCCSTTLHGEELDWDYLEGWRIKQKDVDKFKSMYADLQNA
jgi:HD-like signal output (HDOD) protein